jgi:S-formylglutathione hydrolase FrmB
MARPVSIAILALSLVSTLFAQSEPRPTPASRSALTADSRIQDRQFQSESLARPMSYRVLLPAGYSESSRNYPVLYLLHGWHGDYQNWSTLTKLAFYAKDLPIIVVMPDAGDSWYVDSASVTQDKFERYVIHDLIDEVDQHWRTLRSPHRRAIAGLSMGGYAAVKFALKYPGSFELAGSISGAFNAALAELSDSRADLRPTLLEAFGPARSKTRRQNDVYELATRVDTHSVPYLYIDCGNQDVTFLDPNRKLTSLLSQRKFEYEYHEYPGAHTWQYWDERLPSLLSVVERRIAPEEMKH